MLLIGCRRRIFVPPWGGIDLHVEVPALGYHELAGEDPGEGSEKIPARVDGAREMQRRRFERLRIHFNAQMGSR